MYILFIVLIIIASILLILTVLAQNPKSGMAANFGASNQVMGVRQTADFLERFTWGLSIAILAFSLAATMAMPSDAVKTSNDKLQREIQDRESGKTDVEAFPMPDINIPATDNAPATENAPTAEQPTATEQ